MTPISVTLVFLAGMANRGDGNAIRGRVYNGNDAVMGQFPYQVYLLNHPSADSSELTYCGGVLIAPNYILTAGQCTTGNLFSWILAGLVTTTDTPVGESVLTTVLAQNQFPHPEFDKSTLQNDIGIMQLSINLPENANISPISLPMSSQAQSDTFDNVMATVSGWGQTEDNQQIMTATLQYSTIHVMKHSECESYYSSINSVTDAMICTDKTVINSAPCQGDIGGPLTVNSTVTKNVSLIGIVSWSRGWNNNICKSSDAPIVYTNVATYLTWINSVTNIAIS